MERSSRIVTAALALAVLLIVAVSARAGAAPDWTGKVDPWVLASGARGETEFLVVLEAQADLSGAAARPEGSSRGAWVMATLRDLASATQGPVVAELRARGVEHRPYWISNLIWVRGGLDTVRAMAERPDVRRVAANPSVPLDRPEVADQPAPGSPDTVEWNITKVGAPTVWSRGTTGQGIVVAGQDTGYDWTHPALKPHYRGWSGASADHNYNWHDAIHSGGGVCGANSPQPCDDDAHGTHTMGTMVGDDGAGNQIGMAPGAKWIGCRNMNVGNGTPATYTECFQWFVAPTDLAGANPDPSKAPHVINNSWGCPPSEGCTDPGVLQAVVANVRAAGIVVVVSAGNDGSSCSTVSDPAAIYDEAFSVGATDSTDTIAGFSSRGPVTIDGSGRMKPDISAPGVTIRSSVPGGGYQSAGWSGTSMAGPHVAGGVALLLSAMPSLIHQVDQVEARLTSTALPRTSAQTCGGIPGSEVPNNTYGWGRLDVAAAAVLTADLGITLTDAPDPVTVGQNITYTVTVANAGPNGATGVTVVDTLPAGVTFVASSLACSHAAGVVTCHFGSLASGAAVSTPIIVRATAAGTVVDTATVSSGQVDPQPANNTANASTTVGAGANLAITVTDEPDGVLVGADLTYTLSVTNAGPATTDATVTDTLPAGANFVSASPGCVHGGSTVTCPLGSLSAGADAAATIVVTPTVAASITNTATVAGSVGDPSPANNTASVSTAVLTATPAALAVDAHANALTVSDADGILEPGETVEVEPSWLNPSAGAAVLSGAAVFAGPPGASYATPDGHASYGTVAAGGTASCLGGGDCYVVSAGGDPRPALHWDATLSESLSIGGGGVWTLHVGNSFTDAGPEEWAYPYIETILHRGVTTGCDAEHRLYCPALSVKRDQMAVFLARALAGSDANVAPAGSVPGQGDYNCAPTAGVSLFADVQPTDWFCRHAHRILSAGITTGCDVDLHLYCPTLAVSRGAMAVFIARAVAGSDAAVPVAYTDPSGRSYDCNAASESTYFTDVPAANWTCRYVHYLWAKGTIDGCDPDGHLYCPAPDVLRDAMAKFLTNGFGLTLYAP